jgi:hypothetical protein
LIDHPASDPAKPGSKLAQLQMMRPMGGIRIAAEKVERATKNARKARASQAAKAVTVTHAPLAAATPSSATGQTNEQAGKVSSRKAKESAPAASKRAAAQPSSKGGRPKKIGPKPWEQLGLSKATYFRRKQEGKL